jgi:peptidoglycan/xylan/chitin deacetylase (PgdA/CDA1 family)
MTNRSIVYLMYHELESPGRPLCQPDPGYVRYVLREEEFRTQIEFLKNEGYRGLSVGQALRGSDEKSVVITFDDGSETDLLTAAPILQKSGFGATFYLTSGWIGKPGFLSPVQVREFAAQGFEIGCHSMTHAYLSDLDDEGLQHEIAEAKSLLEQILGAPVHHFSCPGGRYDDRVVKVAKEAGYQTVANSRIEANSPDTDHYDLGRVAVLRDLPLKRFAEICSGMALARLRSQSKFRDTLKQVLGNSLYDRMRGALLGERSTAHRS